MKQIAKTNTELKSMIIDLYKLSSESKVNAWRAVADELIKPTRNKRIVNLFKLNMYTKDGDVIVVPGKVLGTGDINHKVTVAAFSFSQSAIQKIKDAKGNVMSIHELVQKHPKAKDVKVFG